MKVNPELTPMLDLTYKPVHLQACSLRTVMVTEDTMKASKGGKQPAVPPSSDTYETQPQPSRHNLKVRQYTHTLAVTSSLTGMKTYSTGGKPCLAPGTWTAVGVLEEDPQPVLY